MSYFFYFLDVKSVLENSNNNGIGLIVTAILFYLSFYHLILYVQQKKKYFLWYGLFALFCALPIIRRLDNVFFENFLNENNWVFVVLHFPFQTLAFLFFSLFLLNILEFHKEKPIFYKRSIYLIYLFFGIILCSTVVDAISFQQLSRKIYLFLFFPIFSILTFISFFIILKAKSSIKNYLFFGILIFSLFNSYLFITSIGKPIEVSNKFIYLFYIGILIENIAFTLALGKKQGEIFEEKDVFQKNYINQLEKNQKIESSINEILEKEIRLKKHEIIELTKKTEKEKQKKIKLKLRNQLNELHLKSLQSQMNPHFIFNALNSIKAYLIENNKEKAIYYLNKFSKLIRGVLDSMRADTISLKKELIILDLYIHVERIRLNNDLEYTFNANGIDLENISVPPLILQPFIENAILHGLASKKDNRHIAIDIFDAKKKYKIVIKDNGIGREKSMEINKNKIHKNLSHGKNLVKERISYFSKQHNKKNFFKIIDDYNSNGDAVGTTVVLTLEK